MSETVAAYWAGFLWGAVVVLILQGISGWMGRRFEELGRRTRKGREEGR